MQKHVKYLHISDHNQTSLELQQTVQSTEVWKVHFKIHSLRLCSICHTWCFFVFGSKLCSISCQLVEAYALRESLNLYTD